MSDEKTATYVVQRKSTSVDANGNPSPPHAWIDVAEVIVPAQSKRATIIKAALKEAGISPGGEPLTLRVLNAWSQVTVEAKPENPEPQWSLL